MEITISSLQPWQIAIALLALWVFYQLILLIQTRFRSGLRNIPGPFLASISDLDRIRSCASGLQMNYHLDLHRKYGDFVRIGPNHVSFADAGLIPKIYNITSKFHKSDFYTLFDIKTAKGMTPTIFSVRDEKAHKAYIRPVAHAYSMSSLKELEPMNDECTAIFSRKLDGLVGKDIDLGKWLHWYAFDVITSISFSNRLDFMENETDIDNVIAAIEGRLVYNSIIGQKPSLHAYLFNNPIVAKLANLIPSIAILNSSQKIVSFAAKQLQRYHNKETNTVELRDMLDRFKRFKDGEQVMDETELLRATMNNIFAGSDTTAASLRAFFYFTCRTPDAKRKVLEEIDEAEGRGVLSEPVTFAEAQELRYLQACIKEAMRMHPAVGLLLERVVPEGGTDLGPIQLPAGIVIGMNPWVAARDKSTYGEDADSFRPERWLEASAEQLKVMERNDLSFGGGARSCLGKNVSLMEMSKVIPQLLRTFEFELSEPEKEWKLHDYWFVRQTGLVCKVKRRDK